MPKKISKLKSKIFKQIDEKLPNLIYRSGFLSSVYYAFISPAFRREHKSVLAGKVKHLSDEKNYYLLVRNTHRIEKGLLMRPRRDLFGKSYIKETVDAYQKVINDFSEFHQNKQLKWFYDVLKEYFNVVKADEEILQLKKRFYEVEPTFSLSEKRESIPYCRDLSTTCPVKYDDFYALTIKRRSVRWFLDQKVPRELIDKSILAANQSPSACNRQPFEYKIIDNKELLKKIVTLPMGTKGYSGSLPVMIVVVGNLDAYFSERDRHLIYIDASLANMSLMLALETLGLSSCSINWPDIEGRERQMSKLLKLEDHQRVIMCLGVGYPDPAGMVAFSEKRELSQIRKYNFEI